MKISRLNFIQLIRFIISNSMEARLKDKSSIIHRRMSLKISQVIPLCLENLFLEKETLDPRLSTCFLYKLAESERNEGWKTLELESGFVELKTL